MKTTTLTIPADQIAWFRQGVAEEASCDLEAEVPHWEDFSKAALGKVKAIADAAISIFEAIGYVNDPVEIECVVEIDVERAALIVKRAREGIAEEMRIATGDYESVEYDPAKVREVSERALWLNDLAESVSAQGEV